ncbi:MAG TPA: hypothetical protein VMD59_22640, partial [Acidimicrobiales bacterium]|nr:hypothetical protein [Acidimicrobiales bacterium]
AASRHPEAAVAYAAYVAGESAQRGEYFSSGGQPAHGAAWRDPLLDEASGGFFSALLPVLEASWTRPTWPQFAALQNEMIELFARWWARSSDPDSLLDELDERYRAAAGRRAGDAAEQ